MAAVGLASLGRALSSGRLREDQPPPHEQHHWTPNRIFVGRLEIMDVQHLADTGGLDGARQQGRFLGKRHVLSLVPPIGFGLSALIPPPS